MTPIEETIHVNGGEDVVLTVRETLHGPIISDVLEDQPDALAMRWTATSGPSRILQSALSINQAQTFEAFRAAGGLALLGSFLRAGLVIRVLRKPLTRITES